VATMGHPLTHEQIWLDPRFRIYRRFLNVLARFGPDGRPEPLESIHEFQTTGNTPSSPRTGCSIRRLRRSTQPPRSTSPPTTGENTAAEALRYGGHANPRVRRFLSLLLRDVPSTRSVRRPRPRRGADANEHLLVMP
jgi:hypothetical protein